MKLKCLATIATVYLRSNEESVEGVKPPRPPALESRETVAPSGSRADRVLGNGDCCVLLENVSSWWLGFLVMAVGEA